MKDTNRRSDQYLKVNNCGYGSYAAHEVPKTTFREFGRVDYHVLYVLHGVGEAWHNQEKYRLEAGDGVVYLPGEAQEYSFPMGEASMTLWVHFSGTAVDEILQQCGLHGGKFRVASHDAVETIGARLVREFVLLKGKTASGDSAEVTVNGLLMRFLATLTQPKKSLSADEPLISVLEYINRNYIRSDSMEMLASLCRLSTSRFLHRFKELTGVSPNQYRISLRMERAKEYLADATLSVTEVANAVGFSDPLYFSRCFRRENGISPQEYRNREKRMDPEKMKSEE